MRYDSATATTVPDLPTATDIVTGASKGITLASDVTATAVDSNHTGLDVSIPGGITFASGSTITAIQGAAGTAAWPVSLATVPSHPVTQGSPPWAVSAAALPLPTGAATETTLASLLARLPAALVSGRLDVNLGAPATLPVSGTFWQATQPVSAAALPLPSNAAKETSQLETHATVGIAALTKIQTVGGSDYAGSPLAQQIKVDTSGQQYIGNFPATQPVSAATLPLPTGAAQEHVTAVSPHAVRATDGATFYDTRTTNNGLQAVLLSWEEMAGTAAVESALTNATFQTQNLVALTAASSYTVPAAKRFRITNVSCYVKATSTVNNLAKFRIRAVASGSVLNTSTPVFNTTLALAGPGTIAAGLMAQQAYSVPEGSLDFPTGAQLTFTWNTAANTCTVGMTVIGYLYTP